MKSWRIDEESLISVVILGAASLAWLVAVLTFIQRVRLVFVGLKGTGSVVALEEAPISPSRIGGITIGSKPARFPVVEVRDETTGKTIRFRTTIGTSRTAVEIGSQVPVRYLPGHPDQAEIDRPFSMFGAPVLFALVGTVFLALWWYLRALPMA